MNESYLSGEDQRLLDLLVDGELNDVDRRELLLRLERSPDGWRRCAAAFLEAQAWRGEARGMLADEPRPVAALTPASVAASRPSFQIWMPVALAAGLLVATTWVFWNGNSGGIVPGGRQAGNPAAAPTTLAGRPGVQTENHPNGNARALPRNLQLVVDGGPGGRRNVEVPLVDADEMDRALFGQWSSGLPPEVIRLLEQNGHQVVRERKLMPVDLEDGRRVVVPMDQVEIRPVNIFQ
jgi:hypothetical protein